MSNDRLVILENLKHLLHCACAGIKVDEGIPLRHSEISVIQSEVKFSPPLFVELEMCTHSIREIFVSNGFDFSNQSTFLEHKLADRFQSFDQIALRRI